MAAAPSSSRLPRWLHWVLVTIAGLLLALVLCAVFLIFAPHEWMRGILGDRATQSLGREFAVDGDIKIDWDWSAPRVHLHKVRLANAPGAKDPQMLEIEELVFRIRIWRLLLGEINLPRIMFVRPKFILEKLENGDKNWEFPALSKASAVTTAVVPQSRGGFPLLGLLVIREGRLVYRDAPKKLAFDLSIDTARAMDRAELEEKDRSAENSGTDQFVLGGKGTLQGKPFELKATGGSLAMLRDASSVYPLDFRIEMGATVAALKGTFTDPVKMTGVDAVLELKGNDLADLFYLTAIPLPPTPPYKLTGHLVKDEKIWHFREFNGKVGDSDLSGQLSYDTSNERGFVKADMVSRKLDIDDLSGFIGVPPDTSPGETAAPEQKQKAALRAASSRLLPDVPINLTRMKSADMDVRLKAESINAPGWPLNDMDVRFDLRDGVLRLDPLSFGVAGGKISGVLTLDGQKDIPHVESDLTLTRLSLKPFFKDSRFEEFSSGKFGGRIAIAGDGKSLADVLGSSNGRITMMMTGGRVSLLIIEAAGLDAGEAVSLLVDKDKSTAIRCAVGDFKVTGGKLDSEVFVFDTKDTNITGRAAIDLTHESIDARIEAHPKDVSIGSLRSPITLSGPLKSPSIGVDAAAVGARTGIAAALSIFLTPLVGIIPLIELGLGEDSDCRALIQRARSTSGVAPPKP
jgi:uncharacterized protein involved in outer membrane biogenesis